MLLKKVKKFVTNIKQFTSMLFLIIAFILSVWNIDFSGSITNIIENNLLPLSISISLVLSIYINVSITINYYSNSDTINSYDKNLFEEIFNVINPVHEYFQTHDFESLYPISLFDDWFDFYNKQTRIGVGFINLKLENIRLELIEKVEKFCNDLATYAEPYSGTHAATFHILDRKDRLSEGQKQFDRNKEMHYKIIENYKNVLEVYEKLFETRKDIIRSPHE
jgi:hypothetical protein